jgi:hypothetical protein
MRRILFAIVLALALSGPAEAVPGVHPASPPAGSPFSNLFDDEEIRLADSYRVLMGHLEAAGKASLRTSQRRWIRSRNRACGFETRGSCALRLTVARNRDLERTITRQTAWRHWPDARLIELEKKRELHLQGFCATCGWPHLPSAGRIGR